MTAEYQMNIAYHRDVLDRAIRAGNLDRTYAEAKLLAKVAGLTDAQAIIEIVKSVERVTRGK